MPHPSTDAAAPSWMGVLVLDKPSGLVSNHALTRVKRLLQTRQRGLKCGFLGTLDPLASGVLPVFVGKATRIIHHFERHTKTYEVEITLGTSTDTADAEGNIVQRQPVPTTLTAEKIIACLKGFLGDSWQRVPAYAAVKRDGVPLYKLARAGRSVQRPERRISLRALEMRKIELPRVRFAITCSAGTYLRSLAEDVGVALGTVAHLSALRRTACSIFDLRAAVAFATLSEDLEHGDRDAQKAVLDKPYWITAAQALAHLPAVTITDEDAHEVKQGRRLLLEGDHLPPDLLTQREELESVPRAESIRVLNRDGDLIALGSVDAELKRLILIPHRVFV